MMIPKHIHILEVSWNGGYPKMDGNMMAKSIKMDDFGVPLV